MSIRSRSLVGFLLLVLLGASACEEDPAAVILRAGNSESERERYEILAQLEGELPLGSPLRPELGQLLPVIDRWANGREKYWEPGDQANGGEQGYLAGFFAFKVLPVIPDLVDQESPLYPAWVTLRDTLESLIPVFPPAPDRQSPLYPIWCLYHGRMLIQQPIQNGILVEGARGFEGYFLEGRRLLQIAAEAYPQNRVPRMYLDEPIAWVALAPDPAAPEWANLQREALSKLGQIMAFWIAERQAPDGQFGGGWGDDVEMWRNWTPVLLGFDAPPATAAQQLLSEGLWALPRMAGGYSDILTDVEHSAEDSGDTATAMLHLAPEDPVWQRRAMRIAELMANQWTAPNARGQLQFRSSYITPTEIDDSPNRACDTVYHARAIQPALLYWQRSRDPALTALFTHWLDTWVAVTAGEGRGKPSGVIPSSIHFPDGLPGETDEHRWWYASCHVAPGAYSYPSAMSLMTRTLLLAHHMTGDPAYFEPLRSMAEIRRAALADPDTEADAGSALWAGRKLGSRLSGALAKHRQLTGNDEFDDLLLSDANGYVRYRITEEREALIEDLDRSAQAFAWNRLAFTSEVRWSDRLFAFAKSYANDFADPSLERYDEALLYGMLTGDLGDPLYFPLNAVRWRTLPVDIGILVTHADTRGLGAELYEFGTRSRSMGAELLLLEPGSYDWRLQRQGVVVDGGTVQVQEVQGIGPGAVIDFTLRPGRLYTLELSASR